MNSGYTLFPSETQEFLPFFLQPAIIKKLARGTQTSEATLQLVCQEVMSLYLLSDGVRKPSAWPQLHVNNCIPVFPPYGHEEKLFFPARLRDSHKGLVERPGYNANYSPIYTSNPD